MGAIDRIVLEVEDAASAEIFVKALGVTEYVEVRQAAGESSGFRGFTLSLVCSQHGNVDAVHELPATSELFRRLFERPLGVLALAQRGGFARHPESGGRSVERLPNVQQLLRRHQSPFLLKVALG